MGIDIEGVLKNSISLHILRFFGVFTALPNLQIYFQTGVINKEKQNGVLTLKNLIKMNAFATET